MKHVGFIPGVKSEGAINDNSGKSTVKQKHNKVHAHESVLIPVCVVGTAVDDEDVNVSSDVVRVALPDVGVSVDVDSTAIKYNHNVTVSYSAFLQTYSIDLLRLACLYACLSVCLSACMSQKHKVQAIMKFSVHDTCDLSSVIPGDSSVRCVGYFHFVYEVIFAHKVLYGAQRLGRIVYSK